MSRKTRAQLDREITEWLAKEDSRSLGKYERRSDDRTRDGKIVRGDVVSYRDRNRNVVSGVVKSIDARDDALWSGSKSDALSVKQYRDPTYKGDVNITAIVPQSDVLVTPPPPTMADAFREERPGSRELRTSTAAT